MRLAVVLLLIANVLLLAYVQLGRGAGREPDRLADQLNPSAIRLLDTREAVALGVAAARSDSAGPADAGTSALVAPAAAPVPAPAAAPVPIPIPVPTANATPSNSLPAATGPGATGGAQSADRSAQPTDRSAQACLEWGPFSDAERVRAENDIAVLAPGAPPARRPVHLADAWWVNVGALAARNDADKRASELQAKTIDDLSVVDYGGSKFTVSLGVYRTEAAAAARVRALAGRGVTALRVEPWKQPITLTMLVVPEPPQTAVAKFAELQARYPGTELKAIACAASS